MNLDPVVIVDKPNLCRYHPDMDIIVISKSYYDDPSLFSWLLEHEQEHKRIQKQYGDLGVFHHVWLDWKFRGSLMTKEEAQKHYKRFIKLSEKRPLFPYLVIITNLIYVILTFPTIFFQMFSCLKILWNSKKGDI